MSKRLWILTLAAVVGAITLGVAPVVAQDRCVAGAFCDRDSDGLIKQHKRCERCVGDPDCDDDDPMNVCDGTEGEVDHRYAVTFDGSLRGGNISGGASSTGDDWGEEPANGGSVRKFGQPPKIGELNISYFVDEFTLGTNCFPIAVVDLNISAFLYKRRGLAQAGFDEFTACADTDGVCSEIGYELQLEGFFEEGKSWPPSGAVNDSHVLTMTGWSMSGRLNETRNISCSGEGTFLPPVTITVRRTR